MKRIDVINGVNLNILEKRNSKIYGLVSLESINKKCMTLGGELGFEVFTFHSNIEGEIVNYIHSIMDLTHGIVINPGAYTHYSIAIRDALENLPVPVIEVHLSNIFSRESFRRQSVISDVVTGVIAGFGEHSYYIAISAIKKSGKI